MAKCRDFQRKFEESNAGHIVISAFVVVFLFIGVVVNLPYSSLSRGLGPVVRPVAQISGLKQTWAMFAPNPPTVLTTFEVYVTTDDGNERAWPTNAPGRGFQTLNTMFTWPRWRTLLFFLITDPDLRSGYVHYVADQVASSTGHRPVRAEIIQRDEGMLPPGEIGQGDVTLTTLYTEEFRQP